MQRKTVAVIDTNVIVSGMISPLGSPGVILRRLQMGDFDLLISHEQIKEMKDVFNCPKVKKLIPKKMAPELKFFLNNVHHIATVVDPPQLKWDFEDPGDYFLLDLMAYAKPDYL